MLRGRGEPMRMAARVLNASISRVSLVTVTVVTNARTHSNSTQELTREIEA